jgi:hypothetical protein
MFGKTNDGVHRFRFFGIAVVDVTATIFVAWVVSYFFKIYFLYSLLGLFILGILAHRIFCVRTTIDKLLFP